MIKAIYAIFLAVMISLFVGFGIQVVYNVGQYPTYPTELQNVDQANYTAEQKQINEKYNNDTKTYQDKMQKDSIKISITAIAASLILVILSLTVLAKISVIGTGAMLGGFFILIYGVSQSFSTNDNKYELIATGVGLLVALIIGYFKFAKDKVVETGK